MAKAKIGKQLNALSAKETLNLGRSELEGLDAALAKDLLNGDRSFLSQLGSNAQYLSRDFIRALNGEQLNSLSATATSSLSRHSLSGLDASDARDLLMGDRSFLSKLSTDAKVLSRDFIGALNGEQLNSLSAGAIQLRLLGANGA